MSLSQLSQMVCSTHPPGHVWCSMHITLHLCNEKSPNVIHFAEKMSKPSLDCCLKLADCLSASLLLLYRSSQTPQTGNIVAWDWNLMLVSQSHYRGVNLPRVYLHVDRISNRQKVVVDQCERHGLWCGVGARQQVIYQELDDECSSGRGEVSDGSCVTKVALALLSVSQGHLLTDCIGWSPDRYWPLARGQSEMLCDIHVEH